MKIKTVTYRRLVTGENFSNRAAEATAEVEYEKGETPDTAYDKLCGWVNNQLWIDTAISDRRSELARLIDLIDFNKHISERESKTRNWYISRRQMLENVLLKAEANGVKIPEELKDYLDDAIPF